MKNFKILIYSILTVVILYGSLVCIETIDGEPIIGKDFDKNNIISYRFYYTYKDRVKNLLQLKSNDFQLLKYEWTKSSEGGGPIFIKCIVGDTSKSLDVFIEKYSEEEIQYGIINDIIKNDLKYAHQNIKDECLDIDLYYIHKKYGILIYNPNNNYMYGYSIN